METLLGLNSEVDRERTPVFFAAQELTMAKLNFGIQVKKETINAAGH